MRNNLQNYCAKLLKKRKEKKRKESLWLSQIDTGNAFYMISWQSHKATAAKQLQKKVKNQEKIKFILEVKKRTKNGKWKMENISKQNASRRQIFDIAQQQEAAEVH